MISQTTLDRLWDLTDGAARRYGPFASTHEALGVAYEEWREFCDAIHANDMQQVRHEALDLAAVLIRLADSVDTIKDRSTK